MQRLVRLDAADNLTQFLETAAWHRVDGIELDRAMIRDDRLPGVLDAVRDADVHVTALHDTRTATIALREEALFTAHLDRVVAQCNELSCGHLSVHPPRVEIGEHHTIKDLQGFMQRMDAYAAAADVRIAFTLTGFMHDPQLMNLAFEELDDAAVGVAVDLNDLPTGINPDRLLGKLEISIDKVRVPLSFSEMEQAWDRNDDVIAVAERL